MDAIVDEICQKFVILDPKLSRATRITLPNRFLIGRDFNNFSPNYTYSSALTIGNSMNSKHQGYEREKYESPSPNGSDRSKKRSISNASERLPEFSAALTKLGYLKLTRNVVHHGGGFFGRHVDKRYADIRRSYSMLENEKRQQEIMQQHYNSNLKDQYGSVQHVNHVDATPLKVIQHSSRSVDGKENEKPLSSSLHLDLSYQKQDESRAKLKPITNDSQRRHDERRRRMEAEVFALDHRPLIIQYDRRSNTSVSPIKREGSEKREKLSQRDSKKNSKQQKSNSHLTPDSDDRPTSNASLDIPLEKFGSSSQLRESRQQKSPWVYGVNPYRWTSKSAVTDDDKPWIERAMQRTEIVDKTTYDGFARTKPVKAQSSD
ncbi:hypothetical protein FSP39_008321 [Pinctada imbricata]|uniref:Uncharacterized protein n=1 Tax=Pinctada imbricata TaxID=66713 RepID=A0AA89BLX1_PINIB|nr:hypothetical protein FSP39_008321 [Pinctada imbricata]